MTREEKEQTGKYVLQIARLLEDGCYQQEMLLKAVHIIDEALEQEPVVDKIRAEIATLQNRCYALTKGAMCSFCKYECQYKAESEEEKWIREQ